MTDKIKNPASKLKPCPCGKTPEKLYISAGNTCKWAFASGDCCGDWFIEFQTDFYDLDQEECMDLATESWNETGRKADND